MEAYPPDDERFIKRRTSVKDWPVFSDKEGSIAQNAGFGTTGRVKVRDGDYTGSIGKHCCVIDG
jgi:hypothetical protein